jgi:6-phosphogluconolactonase (cycloisomerase 2 family)
MHRSPGFLAVALLLAGCSGNSSMSSTNNPSNPATPSSPGSGSGSGSAVSKSSSTFVYLSSSPSTGKYEISGYSVGSSGALTPIGTSPWSTAGYAPLLMAGHGSYLFGADGYSVYSFSIASDGALKQVSSLQVGTLSKTGTPAPAGGPTTLFYDRSYNTLYSFFINLQGTDNNGYQSYSIDQNSGNLTVINSIQAGPEATESLQFTSNDQFAYSSSCYHGTQALIGVSRASTGALTRLSNNTLFPSPTAQSGDFYCPYSAAADNANHVVVSVAVTPAGSLQGSGPYQLATYTADNSGNLTTTSTSSTMPTTQVGAPTTYLFSADGKCLAVGGPNGLQLFANNNGTLTAVGGLLNTDFINFVQWDSNDALYALSMESNQLYVYTVNAKGATAVSGSPYNAAGASGLAVVSGS